MEGKAIMPRDNLGQGKMAWHVREESTYANEAALRLEALEVGDSVVDEGVAIGVATTEFGAETNQDDL